MSDDGFPEFLRVSARSMRSHPTDVEKAMWWRLRNRNLGGFKFRRQRPIGRHVADFVCLEARLIVELDGAQHDAHISTVFGSNDLKELGYDVIRFTNDAVRKDIDAVCDQILAAVRRRV